LTSPLQCPWGGNFDASEYVIEGTYYKKFSRGEDTYQYLDKSVTAHVDAHLVQACKFNMKQASYRVKGGEPVYKISSEVLEVIHQSLREWLEQDDD